MVAQIESSCKSLGREPAKQEDSHLVLIRVTLHSIINSTNSSQNFLKFSSENFALLNTFWSKI